MKLFHQTMIQIICIIGACCLFFMAGYYYSKEPPHRCINEDYRDHFLRIVAKIDTNTIHLSDLRRSRKIPTISVSPCYTLSNPATKESTVICNNRDTTIISNPINIKEK